MIPDAVLSQIQDRTDIVEIISAYAPLKRSGRNFKANCPFHHEKTPSFMVNPDKQIFHCFGCGVGGNVFSFLMKQEKKDFREVVESLAERVGVEIPNDRTPSSEAAARRAEPLLAANQGAAHFYHDFLLTRKEAQAARSYLEKRGISAETTRNFGLGFAPDSWDALWQTLKTKIPENILERSGLLVSKKGGGFYDRFRNRVIFPIVDLKGNTVAFGGRVLDDSLPKYLNSPETDIYTKGRHLYGLYHARQYLRERDAAIIVEGYMDVIACHQAGVRNAVASLGTALTSDQARLIKRHTRNCYILYDADAAGESATMRGLEICLEEGLEVKIVRLPEGHDPDSFLRQNGPEAFAGELARAQTLFEYKLAQLKRKSDARSVEGRVKIANEMIQLFGRVKNEIARSAWIAELASQLGLSETALFTEMRKGIKEKAPVEDPARRLTRDEMRVAEKLLIGLMLENPEFVLKAKEQIHADDFHHHKARGIAKRILETDGASAGPGQLINVYRDDPESIEIISMACAEMETILDKDKTFSDCLVWVLRSRIHHERQGLASQILAAQRQGDKNRIQQLLVDFNELNKGMKKTHEKK
jgi:DNA primase